MLNQKDTGKLPTTERSALCVSQDDAPTKHQTDLFPETAPTDPLIGRTVTMDGSCQACGSTTALIGPGRGPHLGELRCSSCNKHRQWISRSSYTAIAKFVAEIADTFGAPETIKFIKDRRSESHPCASGTTFSDGSAISAAIRSQHQEPARLSRMVAEKANRCGDSTGIRTGDGRETRGKIQIWPE